MQDTRGQTIGVRLRDGDYRKVSWSGFLSREQAANTPGAKAVKLQAKDYATKNGRWIKIAGDEFLQGCLVPAAKGRLKAYGVVCDGFPVIVSDQLSMFS